jgi:acetyl-CoA C-acetyltransferase
VTLDPERTPVIVATGQCESRGNSMAALELAEVAASEALGAATGLGEAIERLTVVGILSRRAGVTPASDLAKRLGLTPAVAETTSVGGNTPQALVNRAAAEIAAGRLRGTLIAGAEAVRSGRLKPANDPSTTAHVEPTEAVEPDPVLGIYRQDLSDEERAVGLMIPVQIYPMFESVLAHRAGRSPAEQRAVIGEFLAPFTKVAAAHPHAWFQKERTSAEIADPTPDNRLVAEPYTKRMAAFLGGAQGAAIVVTSLAVARRLGIDDGATFIWSGADCDDVWYPLARPDLGRSPAIEAMGAAALGAVRATIDDFGPIDLYSCFPSAVELAAAALGLALDDPRGLTLTGGLPYFGGPGNNYSTHAIATLAERFRSGSGSGGLGLVTALGWYATKHSLGVYSALPPPSGYVPADTADAQRRIDASPLEIVPLGEEISCEAVVDASTVYYDRDHNALGAPVFATLGDGRRVAAMTGLDEAASVAGRWLVGERIFVEQRPDGTPARYKVIEIEGARPNV